MPASSRRALRPISSKRHASPRPARGTRRLDLAARLKARARALRGCEWSAGTPSSRPLREANASQDPRKVAEWMVRQAQSWIPAPCWVVDRARRQRTSERARRRRPGAEPRSLVVVGGQLGHASRRRVLLGRSGEGLARWSRRRRIGHRVAADVSQSQRRRARLSRSAAVAIDAVDGAVARRVVATAARAVRDCAGQCACAAARGSAVGHRRAHAALQFALPQSGAASRNETIGAQRQSAVAALPRSRQLQVRSTISTAILPAARC